MQKNFGLLSIEVMADANLRQLFRVVEEIAHSKTSICTTEEGKRQLQEIIKAFQTYSEKLQETIRESLSLKGALTVRCIAHRIIVLNSDQYKQDMRMFEVDITKTVKIALQDMWADCKDYKIKYEKCTDDMLDTLISYYKYDSNYLVFCFTSVIDRMKKEAEKKENDKIKNKFVTSFLKSRYWRKNDAAIFNPVNVLTGNEDYTIYKLSQS